MSVVGMNSGGACQADNGVAMDADEAPGVADAVALGQVVEDRDGLLFGEVAAIQRRALTLGEAGPAGVAVELAELLVLAVVAADREVAGVTSAVERTAGILAAETCEVVHEANWPTARGGDVFGTELRQSRLILRTIPRHGSTYLGHDPRFRSFNLEERNEAFTAPGESASTPELANRRRPRPARSVNPHPEAASMDRS